MLITIRTHSKRRQRSRRRLTRRPIHAHPREFRGPVRYRIKREEQHPLYRDKISGKRARQIDGIPFRRKFRAWAEQVSNLVGAVTSTRAHYRFSNLPKALVFYVCPERICISVSYRGTCWDVLADLDASPMKVDDGIVDRLTIPEWRVVYPDLDTLWDVEVLDACDHWLRNRLVPAEYIVLGASRNSGATWAELHSTNRRASKGEVTRCPIWKRGPAVSHDQRFASGSLENCLCSYQRNPAVCRVPN